MMVDGGITEGVEEVGGEGGGLIIFSRKETKRRESARAQEDRRRVQNYFTLLYLPTYLNLLLQRSIILFAKNLCTARKKNPSSLFLLVTSY